MSQRQEVYELPGDQPPVAELADDFLPAELAGDNPPQELHNDGLRAPSADLLPTPYSHDLLPTPYSAFSTVSSHPSLKPSPLNFSRPRQVRENSYNFGSQAGPVPEYEAVVRPAPSQPSLAHHGQTNGKTQTNQDEEEQESDDEDDGMATPAAFSTVYHRLRQQELPRNSIDGASIGGASIDEAIPPPIRTYADLGEMDLPRDSTDGESIDEAAPPPIQPLRGYRGLNHDFSTLNISRGDSIYEDFPTPPGAKSPKEQFRKDSQALPSMAREDNDDLPSSSTQSSHPLAHMNTTSSMASSFDEAAPPPVATRRLPLSHTTTESSRGTKSSNQTKASRVDSVVDPSAVRPPKSSASKEPQVLIYRPYLDYASSHRSDSTRTNISQEDSIPSQSSEDNRRYSLADSESSSVSDFAFDGRLGWNPRGNTAAPEKDARRQQRWSAPLTKPLKLVRSKGKEKQQTPLPTMQEQPSRQGSSASSQNALSPATSNASTATGSSASSRPPTIPARIPRIIKRTSIDQMSEHVNPWQGETMSDRGSVSSNEWTSSDVDTSGLSVEKIHKLKKKGINPALYVEMQNARKGKSKWISPLQGNSFIS